MSKSGSDGAEEGRNDYEGSLISNVKAYWWIPATLCVTLGAFALIATGKRSSSSPASASSFVSSNFSSGKGQGMPVSFKLFPSGNKRGSAFSFY